MSRLLGQPILYLWFSAQERHWQVIFSNFLFLSGQLQNHSKTPPLLPSKHTYALISLGELLLPDHPYPWHSSGASNHTFILISHDNYYRVPADISNKAIKIPYFMFLYTESEKDVSLLWDCLAVIMQHWSHKNNMSAEKELKVTESLGVTELTSCPKLKGLQPSIRLESLLTPPASSRDFLDHSHVWGRAELTNSWCPLTVYYRK